MPTFSSSVLLADDHELQNNPYQTFCRRIQKPVNTGKKGIEQRRKKCGATAISTLSTLSHRQPLHLTHRPNQSKETRRSGRFRSFFVLSTRLRAFILWVSLLLAFSTMNSNQSLVGNTSVRPRWPTCLTLLRTPGSMECISGWLVWMRRFRSRISMCCCGIRWIS